MKDIDKRLTRYGSVLGGLVVAGTGTAQVQYVDFNPDTVLTLPESMVIDVNGDLTPDFVFAVSTTTGTAVTIKAGAMNGYGGNGVVATTSVIFGTTVVWASLLSVSNYVASTNNFNSGGTGTGDPPVALAGKIYFGIGSTTMGQFAGQTDAFAGFRFDVGGNWHYGWMRMDVDAQGHTYTIKDMAYEQTPNTSIHVGDMGFSTVGVDEHELQQSVIITSSNNVLTINMMADILAQADIMDLSGRIVENVSVSKGFNQHVLNELTEGIYLVRVTAGDQSVTRKVYIK